MILKPTANLTEEKLEILVQSLQNRLNIYGVSGTKVNLLKDSFSNDNFILVESTSSNKNEVLELLKQKGEFEAKIGNSSVFIGKNVIKVYTDPQNSRVTQCNSEEGGYVCSFSFLVNIDEEGSQKCLI